MDLMEHLPDAAEHLSHIGDLQTLAIASSNLTHTIHAAERTIASRNCIIVRGAYPAEFILNEIVTHLELRAQQTSDVDIRVIYIDIQDAYELSDDADILCEKLWKYLAVVMQNNSNSLAVLKLCMPGLLAPDYSNDSLLQVAGLISSLTALRCLDIQITPEFMQHVKWADVASRCKLLRFFGFGVESREDSEADETFCDEQLPSLFPAPFASVRTLKMTNYCTLPTKLAFAEHFPHADTFIQPVFFKDKDEIAVMGKRFKRLDPRPLFDMQQEPPKVIESLEVAALSINMENENNAVTWELKKKLPALKQIAEIQVSNMLAETDASAKMLSFKPLSNLKLDRVKIDCLQIRMINSKVTAANFNKSFDELVTVLLNTLAFRASLKAIDLALNFSPSRQVTKAVVMKAVTQALIQKVVPVFSQLKLLRIELSGENFNQPAIHAAIKKQDLKLIASNAMKLEHFI